MSKKMNPEVKALWLTALRSGEYEQGQGSLQVNGTFCCLGVLCDVSIKQANLDLEVETIPCGADCDDHNTVFYNDRRDFLPAVVAEWAGLDERGTLNDTVQAKGQYGYRYSSLYTMNDDGVPFSEIADVIEAQF